MSDKEFIIAIVAVIMSLGLLIVGVSKMAELIKAWINRNSSSLDEDKFNRLAKAFVEHKEETQQRIQHLEDLSGERNAGNESRSHTVKESKQNHENIEIEEESKEKRQGGNRGKLRNMLHE